ncbi:MAG TPA: M67 family peptidase [Candidatus Hydrogenedentes bacterium]|nr:M67 family peptidase [Candidatus Hydrogenedentota bacterium]
MTDLRIPQRIIAAMTEQARREAPLEACGILSGRDGVALTLHEMTNADASEEHFTMLPAEQFAVAKRIRAANEEMLAVYHSHPASPARPSREDIRLAFMPDMIYVILSLLDPKRPDVKGFRMDGDDVVAVALEITDE